MQARTVLVAGALVLAVGFAACSEPTNCTDESVPAVVVTVRDAVTNDYLTVVPEGVVQDAAYQDSLRVLVFTLALPERVVSLAGADERRGVYTVRLEAEGYLPWDTSGVAVARNECHVITAELQALLDPAS